MVARAKVDSPLVRARTALDEAASWVIPQHSAALYVDCVKTPVYTPVVEDPAVDQRRSAAGAASWENPFLDARRASDCEHFPVLGPDVERVFDDGSGTRHAPGRLLHVERQPVEQVPLKPGPIAQPGPIVDHVRHAPIAYGERGPQGRVGNGAGAPEVLALNQPVTLVGRGQSLLSQVRNPVQEGGCICEARRGRATSRKGSGGGAELSPLCDRETGRFADISSLYLERAGGNRCGLIMRLPAGESYRGLSLVGSAHRDCRTVEGGVDLHRMPACGKAGLPTPDAEMVCVLAVAVPSGDDGLPEVAIEEEDPEVSAMAFDDQFIFRGLRDHDFCAEDV